MDLHVNGSFGICEHNLNFNSFINEKGDMDFEVPS